MIRREQKSVYIPVIWRLSQDYSLGTVGKEPCSIISISLTCFVGSRVRSVSRPLKAIILLSGKQQLYIIHHVDEENLKFMMKEDIMKARWEKKSAQEHTRLYSWGKPQTKTEGKVEIYALLGYYKVSSGNSVPKFRDNPLVHSSRVKTCVSVGILHRPRRYFKCFVRTRSLRITQIETYVRTHTPQRIHKIQELVSGMAITLL